MSRDEETREWENHKKLVIFLYREHGLEKMMRLMAHSAGFESMKRQYVYRLQRWGVHKNAGSENGPDRPLGQLSDYEEEFYLCLFPGRAFDSYWEQAKSMGDNEQDLSLLLCCARAVETEGQGRQLADHIHRRLLKLKAQIDEDRAFLLILHAYIFHRLGLVSEQTLGPLQESIDFLLRNCRNGESGGRSRTYVIDMPKLVLFDWSLKICGHEDAERWDKVLDFHVGKLSAPGGGPVCEDIVRNCLTWCRKRLESPSARDFSPEILSAPCSDVDGGPARKAIAHVFSFLLSEYMAELATSRGWPRNVNSSLRVSICDVLYTLSALILSGPAPDGTPPLDFSRLCAEPTELIDEAVRLAKDLPAGHQLMVFFLHTYTVLALPAEHSSGGAGFMAEVCDRAKALIPGGQSEDLEFVNQNMFRDGAHI